MDLRILTATIHAARTAFDCGEYATRTAQELENACAAYDGTGESVDRITRAAERLSDHCAAFSAWAGAAASNANNVSKD